MMRLLAASLQVPKRPSCVRDTCACTATVCVTYAAVQINSSENGVVEELGKETVE
jgi:hypothetical protein